MTKIFHLPATSAFLVPTLLSLSIIHASAPGPSEQAAAAAKQSTPSPSTAISAWLKINGRCRYAGDHAEEDDRRLKNIVDSNGQPCIMINPASILVSACFVYPDIQPKGKPFELPHRLLGQYTAPIDLPLPLLAGKKEGEYMLLNMKNPKNGKTFIVQAQCKQYCADDLSKKAELLFHEQLILAKHAFAQNHGIWLGQSDPARAVYLERGILAEIVHPNPYYKDGKLKKELPKKDGAGEPRIYPEGDSYEYVHGPHGFTLSESDQSNANMELVRRYIHPNLSPPYPCECSRCAEKKPSAASASAAPAAQ